MDYPKLKRPPIAEAIVDWNGVLPPDWKLEEGKETLLSKLGQYDTLNKEIMNVSKQEITYNTIKDSYAA